MHYIHCWLHYICNSFLIPGTYLNILDYYFSKKEKIFYHSKTTTITRARSVHSQVQKICRFQNSHARFFKGKKNHYTISYYLISWNWFHEIFILWWLCLLCLCIFYIFICLFGLLSLFTLFTHPPPLIYL